MARGLHGGGSKIGGGGAPGGLVDDEEEDDDGGSLRHRSSSSSSKPRGRIGGSLKRLLGKKKSSSSLRGVGGGGGGAAPAGGWQRASAPVLTTTTRVGASAASSAGVRGGNPSASAPSGLASWDDVPPPPSLSIPSSPRGEGEGGGEGIRRVGGDDAETGGGKAVVVGGSSPSLSDRAAAAWEAGGRRGATAANATTTTAAAVVEGPSSAVRGGGAEEARRWLTGGGAAGGRSSPPSRPAASKSGADDAAAADVRPPAKKRSVRVKETPDEDEGAPPPQNRKGFPSPSPPGRRRGGPSPRSAMRKEKYSVSPPASRDNVSPPPGEGRRFPPRGGHEGEDAPHRRRRRPDGAIAKARSALSRPFGRASLPLNLAKRWAVEVSSPTWDADERRWKYGIVVTREEYAVQSSALRASWSSSSSFTAARTSRSLQDFVWLEQALRAEYHGALLLPPLCASLFSNDSDVAGSPTGGEGASEGRDDHAGRSSSGPATSSEVGGGGGREFSSRTVVAPYAAMLDEAMDNSEEVEPKLLADWLGDALNGIRGQGELILHFPSNDLLSSESMETFLYRNTDPLPSPMRRSGSSAGAAARGVDGGNKSRQSHLGDLTLQGMKSVGGIDDGDGGPGTTSDPESAFLSLMTKPFECFAPTTTTTSSLPEEGRAGSIAGAGGERVRVPCSSMPDVVAARCASSPVFRAANDGGCRPSPSSAAHLAKRLPLEMISCSSRAKGDAMLESNDSFGAADRPSFASPLRNSPGDNTARDPAFWALQPSSSRIAIHSELLEAERHVSSSRLRGAARALERLRSLLEEEGRIGDAWKRFAISLSNLFAFEKDVGNARVNSSAGISDRKNRGPYRKLSKSDVDDALRVLARQKVDRSAPSLKVLNGMLKSYLTDLCSVDPSLDSYSKAVARLASLDDEDDPTAPPRRAASDGSGGGGSFGARGEVAPSSSRRNAGGRDGGSTTGGGAAGGAHWTAEDIGNKVNELKMAGTRLVTMGKQFAETSKMSFVAGGSVGGAAAAASSSFSSSSTAEDRGRRRGASSSARVDDENDDDRRGRHRNLMTPSASSNLSVQKRLFEERVVANESLLKASLTSLCRSTPVRTARMAWKYYRTEAGQASLLADAASALRSKVDAASPTAIAIRTKRHDEERKDDDEAELDLVRRILALSTSRKYGSELSGGGNNSVSTCSDDVTSDGEEEVEESRRALLREHALLLASERLGRWDARLALAIMEAAGVDDAEVRVEETTRDLRLVRKCAIGLRENVERCVEAVEMLGSIILGDHHAQIRTDSTGDSGNDRKSEQRSDNDDASDASRSSSVDGIQIRRSRGNFLSSLSFVFSGSLSVPEETASTAAATRRKKSASPSTGVLSSVGINTSDPAGWLRSTESNESSNRDKRKDLNRGLCGTYALAYNNVRDMDVPVLLARISQLLADYERRVESIESFVYMHCVGIQLEKHFSNIRAQSLAAWEKKTDITTAINIATRKRLPLLVDELKAKLKTLSATASHTTVKQAKEIHLASKGLKAELHDLANRRFHRAKETSTERAINIMSLWAQHEEEVASKELKELEETISEIERSVSDEDIAADGGSHLFTTAAASGEPVMNRIHI